MAKKGKKKGKDKQPTQPSAWMEQMLSIVSAPVVREIVAAGLIAAAGAMSHNQTVRRGARQGARKVRAVAGEAAHEAEELGTAAKRLIGGDETPRRAAKPKRARRNGGAASARPN